MSSVSLERLDSVVAALLAHPVVREHIRQLKTRIGTSVEPFVWTELECGALGVEVPAGILSAWIFVLKRDTPSGAHYHPNSVQHMVVIEGSGRSKIAGEEQLMYKYGTPKLKRDDVWYVINRGVPHEFFPETTDMVVMSFHTCAADELQEVSSETHQIRFYERTH